MDGALLLQHDRASASSFCSDPVSNPSHPEVVAAGTSACDYEGAGGAAQPIVPGESYFNGDRDHEEFLKSQPGKETEMRESLEEAGSSGGCEFVK